MKSIYRYIVTCALLVVLVVPSTTTAQSADEVRLTLLRQLVVLLQERLTHLQAMQPQVSQPVSARSSGVYGTSAAAVSAIRDDKTRDFFARVRELTPDAYLPLLREFRVYNDPNRSDARVDGLYQSDAGTTWIFSVNQTFLDASFAPDVIDELIVHELAHIIGGTDSLPFAPDDTCHIRIAQTEGCPRIGSYYYYFINEFWPNWQLNTLSHLSHSRDPEQFYTQLPGEFVSPYASREPNEDFAESFMFFVLKEQLDTNTVAGQKQAFFNRSSKLRAAKAEILTNL